MDFNWSIYVAALTATILKEDRREAGLPSAQGVLRAGWTESQWALLGWKGGDAFDIIELGGWN